MTTDAIYEERGSDWSHQVSAVGTTRWLQRDQTLPLSAKGVASETTGMSYFYMPVPINLWCTRIKTIDCYTLQMY